MSWVRIDDAAPDHPKLVGLDDDAFALWVRGLCYCARHSTDGKIPLAAVPRMTAAKKWAAVAAKLQAAGLWESTPEGYVVHDFLDYNPSASQVAAKREARAAAGKLGGSKSGESRRSKSEAIASGVASPMSNPVPSPPDPRDPDPPKPPEGGGDGSAAETKPDPKLSAEDRYRAAYVAGIHDAAPGMGFVLSGRMGKPFWEALRTFAPTLTGGALDDWIRRTVAEWRRTADPRFAGGWKPTAFVGWLNSRGASGPVDDYRSPALTRDRMKRNGELPGIDLDAIGTGGPR